MADISKFDDISKLQSYEDYIANNIGYFDELDFNALKKKYTEGTK